jgi:hypothetical protein
MEATMTTTATSTNPALAGERNAEMASTTSVLTLAGIHADANASAAFCVAEAHDRIAEGREDLARDWALRSLAHSVGVFHADDRFAAK